MWWWAVFNNCKSANILQMSSLWLSPPLFSLFSPPITLQMDITLFQQQRPHQQTQQHLHQQHVVIDDKDDTTTKKRIDSAIAMKSNNQLLHISLERPLDHIYLPGQDITGKCIWNSSKPSFYWVRDRHSQHQSATTLYDVETSDCQNRRSPGMFIPSVRCSTERQKAIRLQAHDEPHMDLAVRHQQGSVFSYNTLPFTRLHHTWQGIQLKPHAHTQLATWMLIYLS